jgi:hypothetical protein
MAEPGIASAIPGVLIAASISLPLAVYVIALYLGVHLVEGYILVPLVQRRAVHLPPALTLSAQVVLGFLAGLVGLLFATPLVAAGLVLGPNDLCRGYPRRPRERRARCVRATVEPYAGVLATGRGS